MHSRSGAPVVTPQRATAPTSPSRAFIQLVISHPASDVDSGSSERAARRYNERVASRMRRRSRDEVARFFDGLDLVEPGYAGVGRKP